MRNGKRLYIHALTPRTAISNNKRHAHTQAQNSCRYPMVTHAQSKIRKADVAPSLSHGAAEALHLGVVTALRHHDLLPARPAVDADAYVAIATENSRLLVHAVEAHRVAAFVAVEHRLLADAVQANTLVTAVAEEQHLATGAANAVETHRVAAFGAEDDWVFAHAVEAHA
eukprot:scaffold90922_cov75-Phaeocystis_antarctica.AAC.2